MNPTDTAPFLADVQAEQQRAMLERCGIEVIAVTLPTPPYTPEARNNVKTFYGVFQGADCLDLFDTDDEAKAFARDLAGELIDQGDLSCQ